MNVQANLNLCWAHMSEGKFSDIVAQFISLQMLYKHFEVALSCVLLKVYVEDLSYVDSFNVCVNESKRFLYCM